MTTRTLRLLSVLLALNLLVACSGDDDNAPDGGTVTKTDAGQKPDASVNPGTDAGAKEDAGTAADAGSEDDAGTSSDAGTTPDAGFIDSCDDINADNCLSNLDCASSEVCGDFGDESSAFGCCVLGTRGTGQAGDTCTKAADCYIGLCLERDDGAMFCSGECEGDLDCPGTMFCGTFFGWCVPRDANAPIESCSQVNKDQCFENDNCPSNARCENLGAAENEVFCCTPGPRGTKTVGEACASELECVYGRCLGGLCSAACDFDNDPCPEATMFCSTITYRCEPL